MSTNVLSMLQQRFACARLSHPYMTRSMSRLLTMTFTTAAFDRSSSWQFEALLQSGSEGPSFIFRTAQRFRAFLTRSPVNASRRPSRDAAHHSGSGRLTKPSPWGTSTSYSLPAFLAHSEMGQNRNMSSAVHPVADIWQCYLAGYKPSGPPKPFVQMPRPCLQLLRKCRAMDLPPAASWLDD